MYMPNNHICQITIYIKYGNYISINIYNIKLPMRNFASRCI